MTTPINYHICRSIESFDRAKKNKDSVLLSINTMKIAINFEINTADQLEMFSHGYQFIKNFYEIKCR